MGTPDFAFPCLQSLLDAGHEVCAVFTQPDKPKGRGYAMTPPPVKVLAMEHDIPVYQPKTLRTPEAAQQIREMQPDCIVVVAYGKILPKEILGRRPFNGRCSTAIQRPESQPCTWPRDWIQATCF